MKKNHFLLLVLSCFGFSSIAQLSGTDYGKNFANLMNTVNPEADIEGTPYLFDEWAGGVIVFRDEKGGEFDEIKIDLMNNQLEIMYLNSEKVLPYYEFSKVKLNHPNTHPNTFFQVASRFKYKEERLKGFAKVTPIGEDFKIIEVHTIRVIQSSMDAKIVGAKHKKRYVKETKLYISKKGKVHRVKKKKKFFKLLSRKQKKLKTYIENNDLNIKNETDLIKIVEFYQKNILEKTNLKRP